MAKPKNYEELLRPFVREFGSALSGLTPSQMDEIATLIQKGDIAGARQRMSYIAAAGRGAEYVPRGTKRYNPAKDAPGGELSIRESRPAREFPASTQSPPKAGQGEPDADAAQPGFWRKLLTPLSMDVPRRSGLPGSARPQDTAGDAVRKILGYGAIPGGAVGLAARQLAESGGLPVWSSEQQQEPQEDKPPQRMLNDDILRSLRESTMRQQGMAYPRN